MDGTKLIPENTVTVLALGEQQPLAGHLAKSIGKTGGIRVNEFGNALDIPVVKVRSAVSVAASTALAAFKQRYRIDVVRGHGGSP